MNTLRSGAWGNLGPRTRLGQRRASSSRELPAGASRRASARAASPANASLAMLVLRLALAMTLYPPSLLAAQDAGDSLAIRVAVLEHLRPEISAGPVKLHPTDVDLDGHGIGGLTRGHMADLRNPGERPRGESMNRALEEATGTGIAAARDVLSCRSGPQPDCRVRGASAFVSLSAIQIEGARARLTAQIVTEGGRGGTLHLRNFAFVLEERDGQWVVLERKLVLVT